MLYITTKDKNDVHTAYKALHNDIAANGSNYIPFHLPCFSSDELRKLRQKSFGQITAEMINLFFNTNLTGWDVDFALGRNVAKVKSLSGKTYIAELWHNAGGNYSCLVDTLYSKVCNTELSSEPTLWFRIAVRIALLFAVLASSDTQEEFPKTQNFDLCVSAVDDLSMAAAAFYARKMGLPINNIVCVCQENSAVWEFLYRGICQRKAVLPDGFECLVDAVLGFDGLCAYLQCKAGEGSTVLPEDVLADLQNNVFVSAVGQQRINAVTVGTYRTNRYVFTTEAAMTFGGLQDYRASTGESRSAIIMMDTSPLDEVTHITDVLGITKKELSELI